MQTPQPDHQTSDSEPREDSITAAEIEQEAGRIFAAFRAQRMFAPLPMHPKAWERARELAAAQPSADDVYEAWQVVKSAKRNGADAALEILVADFERKLTAWLSS